MDKVDAVVVGAGVVGLAAARALALQGMDVVILEAEGTIGSGVSSRNSEVIHAGLYYPQGSLKARLCVAGRALLYAYCEARGIGHRRCGKLLVATRADDGARLDAILAHGLTNGVADLRRIDTAEARAMEPALACTGALWSPSSGIVDSHGLMLALLGDAEHAGALLALHSPFVRAWRDGGQWVVEVGAHGSHDDDGSGGAYGLACDWIVNAAGLDAQRVALAMDGFPAAAVPRRHIAKGNYFALAGKAPFTHLVYPTPVDGGLGVHLTLDLGGQARFGPDVQWLADDGAIDYAVDGTRQAAFEADIRRYWPGLPAGALQPAYCGVRPKLSGPGAPAADFVVAGPAEHGCDGVLQLFGIESPGLTASLAIAELLRSRVGSRKAAA